MKRPLFSILLSLILFAPLTAGGHELWFEDAGGPLVLYRGHGPDAAIHTEAKDHGEANAPCPRDQYLRATVVDNNGALHHFSSGQDIPKIWPPEARAMAVTVSSGCWTKTPRGTVNLPRDRAESPLTSWRSFESIKHIRSWDPSLVRPLVVDSSGNLEITPLTNPLRMNRGDKLQVLVTSQGKPVVGSIVTYNGKPRGVTGPRGMINIRLKQDGRQSLATTVTTPMPNDEEVDEVIATFLVRHAMH